MTTLTRGDYTKATRTTLSTYALPVITDINGKATADDQNGFTKEMYVQRIFVIRRLNQWRLSRLS